MPGSLDARYDAFVAQIDIPTSLDNLKLERDAIVLYEALSAIENDPHRAAAFERIASNERRHAGIWADKLKQLGANVPPAGGPPPRGPPIPSAPRARGARGPRR